MLTYQIHQTACPLNVDTADITITVSYPFITTPNISNSIRANNLVRQIGIQSTGKIIIAGYFTTYNNISKKFMAKLNTDLTLDTSFNGSIATAFSGGNQYFAPVNDFKIQSDDKIIVVTDGPYAYGGSSAIARLNQNGDIDPTFVTGIGITQTNTDEGAYCNVEACAIQPDGKILIGGRFDTYNGTPVRSMIRLNQNGSIDPTFTFPYPGAYQFINGITVMPSGDLLVSGLMFPVSPPVEAMQKNLVKLDTYGNVDPNFTIGSTGLLSDFNPQTFCVDCTKFHILKMLVQPADGKILIAGSFNMYNGTQANCIVRLFPNGNIDPIFNQSAPSANRVIYDLDLDTPASTTSDILFCGEFTTYNGSSVKKMARMHTNGSIADLFNIGTGTLDSSGSGDLNNFIRVLKRQSDGKIIVGGKFTSFNGITAGNITRIQGNNGTQAKNGSVMYVSEPEIDINSTTGNLGVYPNPSNGIFNVDLTRDEGDYTKISLYNLLGQEIYNSSIISKQINEIDISSLPSGYYIARISNENSSIQVKLLKE